MVTSIQNNASALNAFSKQMAVNANNVANSLSDNFKKSRAINTEGTNGQVTVSISRVNTPGPLVEDPLSTTGELKELSNTDLAEALTDQIAISHGYSANVKTIQTHDETLGTLIDMVG